MNYCIVICYMFKTRCERKFSAPANSVKGLWENYNSSFKSRGHRKCDEAGHITVQKHKTAFKTEHETHCHI